MMLLPVTNLAGEQVGEIELDDAIFATHRSINH